MNQDPLLQIRSSLQNSLDQLLSPRSPSELQGSALQDLERQVASYVQDSTSESYDCFLALQYTFECNVPSRLLPWIVATTRELEIICNKGFMDGPQQREASVVSSHLSQSLSLLQGIALIHTTSKEYLGRRSSLEVLVDLLLASRHLSPGNPTSPKDASSQTPSQLSAVVLDTLLCILVDSPDALRAFEDSSGVQSIVKLLKRAGTPRDVRMKCLEFLYFYLLDEVDSPSQPPEESGLPPVPNSPTRDKPAKKLYLTEAPRVPVSRYGSSTYAFSSPSSDYSTASSRSTSGSSTQSFSSTSSNASSSTAPSSAAPSAPPSPKKARMQPRSLMMLKREVEFTPSTPQKGPFAGKGRMALQRDGPKSDSSIGSAVEELAKTLSVTPQRRTRTRDEKKELLGTMLGNVDALVDSVSRAGIWGLG